MALNLPKREQNCTSMVCPNCLPKPKLKLKWKRNNLLFDQTVCPNRLGKQISRAEAEHKNHTVCPNRLGKQASSAQATGKIDCLPELFAQTTRANSTSNQQTVNCGKIKIQMLKKCFPSQTRVDSSANPKDTSALNPTYLGRQISSKYNYLPRIQLQLGKGVPSRQGNLGQPLQL